MIADKYFRLLYSIAVSEWIVEYYIRGATVKAALLWQYAFQPVGNLFSSGVVLYSYTTAHGRQQ